MNKTTTGDKERLVYVLYGYDTFSSESYTCGVYRHRSSANRAMRKREEEVEDQYLSVRDTFGISVYTESWYRKVQMEEQKEIDAKYEIKTKNQSFVSNNAKKILKRLKKIAADTDFESYIKEYLGKGISYDERSLVGVPSDMYIESIFLHTEKNRMNEDCFFLGIRMREMEYADRNTMLFCIAIGTFDDFRKEVIENYTTETVCIILNKSIVDAIYDNYC